MNFRDRKIVRRVATVVIGSLLLVPLSAGPASAAGLSHGYCGHATSNNWVNGWNQTFNWEQGGGLHSVTHSNMYTGEGPYTDSHRCH